MSVGRLFHTRGAATANARSPNLLRVRGTYRSPLSAVSNEARDGRSATGLCQTLRQSNIAGDASPACPVALTPVDLHFVVLWESYILLITPLLVSGGSSRLLARIL